MAQNVAGASVPVTKKLKIMGPGVGPVFEIDDTQAHSLDSEGRPIIDWKQTCCHNGVITVGTGLLEIKSYYYKLLL